MPLTHPLPPSPFFQQYSQPNPLVLPDPSSSSSRRRRLFQLIEQTLYYKPKPQKQQPTMEPIIDDNHDNVPVPEVPQHPRIAAPFNFGLSCK